MIVALSLLAILAAWVLLLLQVDPVPTWFYVFVWYPTLVLLDELGARAGARSRVFRNPRLTVSLLAWSPVIWLLFEAANFRLRNWYYVFLPRTGVERWAGILLSFATVAPAILLAERLFAAAGVGRSWHGRSITIRDWELHAAVILGLATGALALAWPQLFFPLIWGAVWLILDPFVYRRNRAWSLLGDLERGAWGRIGRLMLGGLAIGLLWEFYNHWARGKWIYTVPWLEQTKLFEMPPFGFLGFPVFALEAWTIYHVLCALRVAVPPVGIGKLSRPRLAVAAVGAAAFATATLLGMERWTISSHAPRLADLPNVGTGEVTVLQQAGIASPFDLARTEPDVLSHQLDISGSQAADLVHGARLATLRGIGTEHARTLRALGVRSVCDLAARDAGVLWRAVHEPEAGSLSERRRSPPVRPSSHPSVHPTRAEVRVWVGAAARSCPGPMHR